MLFDNDSLEVKYRIPLNGRDGWYYRRKMENGEWLPWWGGTGLETAFATVETALEAANYIPAQQELHRVNRLIRIVTEGGK